MVGPCVCLAGQAGARWVATAKTDSASACACRARSCPPGAVFAPVSRDLGGFLRVRGRPMDYSGGAGASSTARQLAVVGCLPRVGAEAAGAAAGAARSIDADSFGWSDPCGRAVAWRAVPCAPPRSNHPAGSVGVGTGMSFAEGTCMRGSFIADRFLPRE